MPCNATNTAGKRLHYVNDNVSQSERKPEKYEDNLSQTKTNFDTRIRCHVSYLVIEINGKLYQLSCTPEK